MTDSSVSDGQVGKRRVTANICNHLRTERRHVFTGTAVVWCKEQSRPEELDKDDVMEIRISSFRSLW